MSVRTMEEIEKRFRRALRRRLPGARAHLALAPRPRPGWRPGRIPAALRPGAALLLFYPLRGEPHLVLTVRARHLPSHAGQVSLPGGAVEAGESIVAAALREAREEVAIEPGAIRVLGALSPLHIPASGYVLNPVVASAAQRPDLRAADGEVDRILEVPVAHLGDPSRLRRDIRELRGRSFEVPFFDVGGEKVWGATAMVLAEALWVLGSRPAG